MITFFLSVQDISPPPINDTKELLGWIIGVLIFFILGIITYFTVEKKRLLKSLEDAFEAYQKEVEYNKSENKDNVKLMTEVSIYMKNQSTAIEKNSSEIAEMKAILNTINTKI